MSWFYKKILKIKDKKTVERRVNRLLELSGEDFIIHISNIKNTINKILDNKDETSSYDSHLCFRHINTLLLMMNRIEEFENSMVTESELKDAMESLQIMPFPTYKIGSKYHNTMINDISGGGVKTHYFYIIYWI